MALLQYFERLYWADISISRFCIATFLQGFYLIFTSTLMVSALADLLGRQVLLQEESLCGQSLVNVLCPLLLGQQDFDEAP